MRRDKEGGGRARQIEGDCLIKHKKARQVD
jgi:hypothetical protein